MMKNLKPVFYILSVLIISAGLMGSIVVEPSIVITSDEIKANAWPDMQAIIESLPGFYFIDTYGLDGPVVAYRGFSPGNNGNILWMRNGIELIDAYLGETSYSSIDIAPGLIDRIEVWREGEYPGAFSAAINIVTIDQETMENTSSCGFSYGTGDLLSGCAKTGFKAGDVKINGALSYKNLDGIRESFPMESGNSQQLKLNPENNRFDFECSLLYNDISVFLLGTKTVDKYRESSNYYLDNQRSSRNRFSILVTYKSYILDKLRLTSGTAIRFTDSDYRQLNHISNNDFDRKSIALSMGFEQRITFDYSIFNNTFIKTDLYYSYLRFDELREISDNPEYYLDFNYNYLKNIPNARQLGAMIGIGYTAGKFGLCAYYGNNRHEYYKYESNSIPSDFDLDFDKDIRCLHVAKGEVYYTLPIGKIEFRYNKGHTRRAYVNLLFSYRYSPGVDALYSNDSFELSYTLEDYHGLKGYLCSFYRKVNTLRRPYHIGEWENPYKFYDALEVTGGEIDLSYDIASGLDLSLNVVYQHDEYVINEDYDIPSWACPEWMGRLSVLYSPCDFLTIGLSGKYTGDTKVFAGKYVIVYEDGHIIHKRMLTRFDKSYDADGSINCKIPWCEGATLSFYCRNIFNNKKKYARNNYTKYFPSPEKKREREFYLSAGYSF